MVQFKDLHKKAEDLVTKDWCHENVAEVENNWKSSEGWTFKNKATFPVGGAGDAACCPALSMTCCKAPVTITEVSYEDRSSVFTAKVDSEGKANTEVKLKSVFPGLTINNKLTCHAGKACTANSYEMIAEYLHPENKNAGHSVLNVTPFTGRFTLSTVLPVHKQFNLGAEVSGSATAANVVKSLKYTVGGAFHVVNNGTSMVGVKATQDFSKGGAVNIVSFLHFIQGKTETAASMTCAVPTGGKSCPLPSVLFTAKTEINPDTWVKASINDALAVRGVVGYRVSPLFNASLGVGVDPAAKAAGDQFKVGAKFTFST